MQTVPDDYGTDWEGPVPIDDDNTVHINDLPNFLSDEEKAILLQQLLPLETLNEERLLHNFTITEAQEGQNFSS